MNVYILHGNVLPSSVPRPLSYGFIVILGQDLDFFFSIETGWPPKNTPTDTDVSPDEKLAQARSLYNDA